VPGLQLVRLHSAVPLKRALRNYHSLQVLASYYPWPVPASDYNYPTITGTDLNLGDDSVASITSPFPIQFGGGSFSTLYVSSNGTISFTDVFGAFDDASLPLPAPYPPVATRVAPFWKDLYPVQVSGNSAASDNNVYENTGRKKAGLGKSYDVIENKQVIPRILGC
jgi:hypothetical protein